MNDSEKIIEEIVSERTAEGIRDRARINTLLDKLITGYLHAEKRIDKYYQWKRLRKDLESKGIDYKTDEFLNPVPSDEEKCFFRYITDDKLMRTSGLIPGEIHSGFYNDTYIFNYYLEYRRILKKGNRWKEIVAEQVKMKGKYWGVTERIIRAILVVGLIGSIVWGITNASS